MIAGGGANPIARLCRLPRIFFLLIALAAGILLAPILAVPPLLIWIAAGLLLVSALLLATRTPAAIGLVLLILPVLLHGAASARVASAPAPHDIAALAGTSPVWICGRVVSDVETRQEHGQTVWTMTLAAEGYENEQSVWPIQGKLRIFGRNGLIPSSGSRIFVHGMVETPEGRTNPDGFDYRAFLARRGIYSTLRLGSPGDVQIAQRDQEARWQLSLRDLKTGILGTISAHLPPSEAALLTCLLFGNHGTLPAQFDDAVARTGTIHLLTAAGLHVAALGAILFALFSRLPLSRRMACASCIPFVWVFAMTAGAGPAVCRAALMTTVALAAPLLRRVPDPLASWAFAAFIVLLADPLALYDAGFQLTFATVFLILLYLPPLERWLLPFEPGMRLPEKLTRGTLAGLLLSVIAALGSSPLMAYHFHLLSLVTPISNLVTAPLAEILLIGGLSVTALSSVLDGFTPILLSPFWSLLGSGLKGLGEIIQSFAAVPFAAVSIVSPPGGLIVAYYMLLVGIAPFIRRRLLRKAFLQITPVVN